MTSPGRADPPTTGDARLDRIESYLGIRRPRSTAREDEVSMAVERASREASGRRWTSRRARRKWVARRARELLRRGGRGDPGASNLPRSTPATGDPTSS